MIRDVFQLLFGLVPQLWGESHLMFLTYCFLGFVLAGGAWWLTRWIAFCFNRQYFLHLEHDIFCATAAALTLLFFLVFIALQNTAIVAEHMVERWKDAILMDQAWSADTFRQAYEAVYELRDASGNQLENFAGHPHPDTGLPTSVPTSKVESQRTAAETYAKGAVTHFRTHHPLLSKILWAHADSAQQAISQDMERVFGSGSHTYSAADAVNLAGEKIRQGLKEQVPRIVVISRVILIFAFLLAQGIVQGLMIYLALRKIRVPHSSQSYVGG